MPTYSSRRAPPIPPAFGASADNAISKSIQDSLRLPWFRCYTSDDIVGVEWAGAMKNPYAIAAGIAKGLNLGDNAIAALVTRALAEMVRLGTAQGGHPIRCFPEPDEEDACGSGGATGKVQRLVLAAAEIAVRHASS